MKYRLKIQEYLDGINNGDRIVLAKAITLAESQLNEDRKLFDLLLEKVIGRTGNSIRIGITGAPGVGKSTFIEAFGKYIIQAVSKRVAVLTIDPSSQITKGSILGDKTRMAELARMSSAFIRPTSSGVAVGGVTDRTREAILLCEAAGFEIIIIETVGVGQSETTVKKLVDFFILLMLAGAGDELQGIKKGIMEMADLLVITKADGANKSNATKAQAEYQHAINLFHPDESGWVPKTLTCSAITGDGIEAIWNTQEDYIKHLKSNGFFGKIRQRQLVNWMYDHFDGLIKSEILNSARLSTKRKTLEEKVQNKKMAPQHAALELMNEYIDSIKNLAK